MPTTFTLLPFWVWTVNTGLLSVSLHRASRDRHVIPPSRHAVDFMLQRALPGFTSFTCPFPPVSRHWLVPHPVLLTLTRFTLTPISASI